MAPHQTARSRGDQNTPQTLHRAPNKGDRFMALFTTPPQRKAKYWVTEIRAVQPGGRGALGVELGNNSLEVCTMLWNTICIFVRRGSVARSISFLIVAARARLFP